jgi:tetratricopeptide (TPR) repeat protein
MRIRCCVGALLLSAIAARAQFPAATDPPKSPIAVPAIRAFPIIAEFKESPTPTDEERDLFDDAGDGRLDRWTPAEAYLLASGVTDKAKRNEYLVKLDALEANAKQAIAGARETPDVGERLLRHLHAGPFRGGYSGRQSSLATLLDKGQYNCLSATIVYCELAKRLGKRTRAIEIPEHIFAILFDGDKPLDVETTNRNGFNPRRDDQTSAQLRRPDGDVYVPSKHADKRREIGEIQLIAAVYSNRCSEHEKEGRYHEAVIAGFSALCLDPASQAATRNALAALANWGPALANAGSFTEAVKVGELGVRLAPDEPATRANFKATWIKFARAEMKAGRETEAVAVLRRGLKATRDPELERAQALLFLAPAELQLASGNWMQAHDAVNAAVAKVDPNAAKVIRDWQADLFIRWSNERLKAGDMDGSFAALDKGEAAHPKDKRYASQAAFLAQEQLKAVADKGVAELARVAQSLRKRFPNNLAVQKAGANYVGRLMQEKIGSAKFKEAIALLDEYAAVVGSPRYAKEQGVAAYDGWARSFVEKDEFEKAVQVYAAGLKVYPRDPDLTNNAEAVCDRWAKPFIDAKSWAQALAVYERGLELIPGSMHLASNRKACQQRLRKR